MHLVSNVYVQDFDFQIGENRLHVVMKQATCFSLFNLFWL